MKDFGYSSAAVIGLLVATAGLSLAAVIANLPLQGEGAAEGSWTPRSDTLIAAADRSEPALSQPIEDSFLVSFDLGADLRDADFVAMAQHQSSDGASLTIQSEQIDALGALSPAAGPALSRAPVAPAEAEASPGEPRPQAFPADEAPSPRRPHRASAELRERRDVAPLRVVALSPAEPAVGSVTDTAARPVAQIAIVVETERSEPQSRATQRTVPAAAPPEAASEARRPAPRRSQTRMARRVVPQAAPQPEPAPEATLAPAAPPVGYVVIGSFLRLDAAAAHVLKYQDWQPTIVAGRVGDKLYRRVVVGPFSEGELREAWQRIVAAGVEDAWRLTLEGETDLAVKDLDVLG